MPEIKFMTSGSGTSCPPRLSHCFCRGPAKASCIDWSVALRLSFQVGQQVFDGVIMQHLPVGEIALAGFKHHGLAPRSFDMFAE